LHLGTDGTCNSPHYLRRAVLAWTYEEAAALCGRGTDDEDLHDIGWRDLHNLWMCRE
jgi:hypothetical protein